MSTQTLDPNANWANATRFTVTGAASAWEALSDASDSTSIIRTSASVATFIALEAGTYTLAADEQVVSVRVRARMARPEPTSRLFISQGYITDRNSKATTYGVADRYNGTAAIGWVEGTARTVAPDGAPWDQERLNNLVVQLFDYATDSASRTTIYEVEVIVEITEQPTLTVDAPTGTVSDTSRPAITWTYSDTDGDEQAYYRVKIFTAAQYGAADFDPETSEAFLDTGQVTSSDPGATIATDLTNGVTHRAYVKAGQDLNGRPYWSAWAYSTFLVDFEAPPAPVISANFSTLANRVALSAQASTNILDANTASLESTLGTWSVLSSCTVARGTTQALEGTASLEVTATSTTAASAQTGLMPAPTSGVAVSGSAYIRPGGVVRQVRARLRWHDAVGAALGFSDGTLVTQVAGQWAYVTITDTPPAGATQVRMVVQIQSPTTSEVHYVDKISLHPGPTPTWSPGGLTTGQQIVIERSDDGGTTWTDLRGTPVLTDPGTQIAQVDDYEAPRDQSVQYRARAIGFRGSDAVASAYSDAAAAFVINDKTWWAKAVTEPSLNVGGLRVLEGVRSQVQEAIGVFRPRGRTTPVVVAGEIYGLDGGIDVFVGPEDDWDAVRALLLEHQGVILLQDPFSRQRYVRIVSRDLQQAGPADAPRYTVTVSFVEVGP